MQFNKKSFALIAWIALAVAIAIACADGTSVEEPEATALPMAQCPSPEERAYFDRMSGISERQGDAVNNLGLLTVKLIEDTSLLYDRAWNTQANTHLADLHQTVREVKEVVPPASAEDLHADYLRKAAELQAFANIFRPAIDNTDTQLMAQGNEHLSTATDLTLALKEKVANFCG